MKLNLKLKGVPKVIQVSGNTFEDDEASGELRVKDDAGKVIARFNRNEVAGWWVEPEYRLTEEEIKRANEVVEEMRCFDSQK